MVVRRRPIVHRAVASDHDARRRRRRTTTSRCFAGSAWATDRRVERSGSSRRRPTGTLLVDGEVLVAEMTSPDWVPTMRRAAALITDAGGSTCHAAIVSRELGLPRWSARESATTRAARRRRRHRRRATRRWSFRGGQHAGAPAAVVAASAAAVIAGSRAAGDPAVRQPGDRRSGGGGRRARRRRRRAAARRVHGDRGARRPPPAGADRERWTGRVHRPR